MTPSKKAVRIAEACWPSSWPRQPSRRFASSEASISSGADLLWSSTSAASSTSTALMLGRARSRSIERLRARVASHVIGLARDGYAGQDFFFQPFEIGAADFFQVLAAVQRHDAGVFGWGRNVFQLKRQIRFARRGGRVFPNAPLLQDGIDLRLFRQQHIQAFEPFARGRSFGDRRRIHSGPAAHQEAEAYACGNRHSRD